MWSCRGWVVWVEPGYPMQAPGTAPSCALLNASPDTAAPAHATPQASLCLVR